MTPEQRNVLKQYIDSESGKAFLQLLINSEITLQSEAWNQSTTPERQLQLTNRIAGMYDVRNRIAELVKQPKELKKKGKIRFDA